MNNNFDCVVSWGSKNNLYFYEKNEEGKLQLKCYTFVSLGKRVLVQSGKNKEDKSKFDKEAKDLTPRKLFLNPEYLLSVYLPEWEGKSILIKKYPKNIEIEKLALNVEKKVKEKVDTTKLDFQFKVGDIVYSSWGYDQTNVSFYQIVGRKNRTATIRRIKSRVETTGFMSGTAYPIRDSFTGEALNRKIRIYGNKEDMICNVEFSNPGFYDEDVEKNGKGCSWYA